MNGRGKISFMVTMLIVLAFCVTVLPTGNAHATSILNTASINGDQVIDTFTCSRMVYIPKPGPDGPLGPFGPVGPDE